MSSNSRKLVDLASAKIGKTDKEKALAELHEAVSDNKMNFELDKHNAAKNVASAKKALDALAEDPSARASQIIAAKDNLAVAEKELEQITAIISERF